MEFGGSKTSHHSVDAQSQVWQIWLVLVSTYCVYKSIQNRNVVWPGQRSRFLVLTKKSAASGDENKHWYSHSFILGLVECHNGKGWCHFNEKWLEKDAYKSWLRKDDKNSNKMSCFAWKSIDLHCNGKVGLAEPYDRQEARRIRKKSLRRLEDH